MLLVRECSEYCFCNAFVDVINGLDCMSMSIYRNKYPADYHNKVPTIIIMTESVGQFNLIMHRTYTLKLKTARK